MIEIIYENSDQTGFFTAALDEIKFEYRLRRISELELDLAQPPDEILYINLISQSEKIVRHDKALLFGEQYLEYLATYNRRVINDYRTFNYQISRVEQIKLFKRNGLAYPQTLFGAEKERLLEAAQKMPTPFVTTHNLPTSDIGKEFFNDVAEFESFLESERFVASPDGIMLLQEFIKPKDNKITKVAIIDGQLVYAYQIEFTNNDENKYIYLPDFKHQLISKYIEISKQVGYDIATFEYIEATNGAVYTCAIDGLGEYPKEIEEISDYKAKKAFLAFIGKLI